MKTNELPERFLRVRDAGHVRFEVDQQFSHDLIEQIGEELLLLRDVVVQRAHAQSDIRRKAAQIHRFIAIAVDALYGGRANGLLRIGTADSDRSTHACSPPTVEPCEPHVQATAAGANGIWYSSWAQWY
ncbi:hypothetical protein D3C71_1619540 [compost metagenome]